MDIWLWHLNEDPIIPMGGSNVPKIQKSSPSSIECQGDADSFCNAKGAVHHEYLPRGSIVNHIYYIVLKHVRDAIRRKRPELWTSDN